MHVVYMEYSICLTNTAGCMILRLREILKISEGEMGYRSPYE
jgi:hypothetical protein